MAPRIKAGINSKSVSQRVNPATAAIVEKKLSGASVIAPPRDERKVLSLRAMPLSNRIMIKVMAVKMGPTAPNCEGEVKPNTGRMQTPIIINRITSGILVRLKMPVKRCARKTRIPTKAITGAISCMGICS